MNYFLTRSKELFDETVANRRYIHENAEVGMDLPNTVRFVKEKLKEYGYDNVQELGGGVTCTVGQGEKVLLLRGDMDALPHMEESGEPFACTNGACHSCGHDTHTAMLLTAAKMLKEKESELKNTIKFMFQPGEELLEGANAMIAAGILENPTVTCAIGMHSGGLPIGALRCCYGRTKAAAGFKVTVKGADCHGSAPWTGVSALSAAANIVTMSQQIVGYDVTPGFDDTITYGVFNSGTAENTIPGEAILMGTIRSYDNDHMDFLKERFEAVINNVAAAARVEVTIEYMRDMYGVVNNADVVDEFKEYLSEVTAELIVDRGNDRGSEDFAAVTVKVPSIFVNVGMGTKEEGYEYPGHHPKNRRDEKGMINGAAAYANCAFRWANK